MMPIYTKLWTTKNYESYASKITLLYDDNVYYRQLAVSEDRMGESWGGFKISDNVVCESKHRFVARYMKCELMNMDFHSAIMMSRIRSMQKTISVFYDRIIYKSILGRNDFLLMFEQKGGEYV